MCLKGRSDRVNLVHSRLPAKLRKGYYCGTPCNQTECPEGNWCPEGSHLPIACPWWSKCAEGTADKVSWLHSDHGV